ncbi:MAG TPA: ABC transporter substrate-binding protein [Methanotrichaceae archaeon]|nr:ABC transporter substrate-binding protein [Methanotrichaceae archaeon]HQF15751.1 ABC transporter substrate-binding protein [Methanotrichaceae archaeon]HQI90576.1 ABC transporter substrate-binding protein [Methanotrichaceae archaeon]
MILALPALGEDGFPKTIVDSADRTVTIEKPVERIVLLNTYSYEPIYVLGLEDKLVGVTSSAKSLYPWLSGMKEKPVVGTYLEFDHEKMVGLKPDLIIASSKVAEDLESKVPGARVLSLRFVNQSLFERELKLIAEITGSSDLAEEYLDWRQRSLDLLKKNTDRLDPKDKFRVYCEWAEWPLHSGGKGSPKDITIRLAGGRSITGDLGSDIQYEISPEWLVMQNPQAILFENSQDAYYNPITLVQYNMTSTERAERFLSEAAKRKELEGTDAVKNGRMFILEEMMVDGSRSHIGSLYLAKWLYPDQFKDLDPEAIHKEYFERWLGVPYKGIWAYPPAPAS